MSFNSVRKNTIIAKISEFTVNGHLAGMWLSVSLSCGEMGGSVVYD